MQPVLSATASIPQVKAPPWVGSAFAAAHDAPGFFLRESRKLGPVFRFQAFNRRFVVLAGKTANLFANKQGARVLSSKEVWQGLNHAYGTQDTLISRDGPTHRQMRKVQKDGYARNKLAGKVSKVVAITREELAKHVATPMSVHTLLTRLVSLQLGYLTMGVKRNDHINDVARFLRTTLACTVTQQRPRIMLFGLRYRRARARSLRRAEEILDQIDPNAEHLLADLMALHRKDPQALPKQELLSCVLAPFVAGLDTAASTLAFALYHVARTPKLAASIQEQSDRYFHNTPTLEGLADSKIAYATILETLRCNPIAPALSRTASCDFEFEGFAVPKHSRVILATTVTHHDPRYFPAPERFEIERYLGDRAEHRQPGAYVPFGVGPHICLGAGLASALMLLNLKLLMHDHTLEFSGAKDPLPLNRVPTIRPADAFRVTLRPR